MNNSLIKKVLHKSRDLIWTNGKTINIGGKYEACLDWRFRGYSDFGDRHNKGWELCINNCAGKKVFIDVGAHIGLYAVPASIIMYPNGKVYAFEPSIVNHAYLERHIELNNISNCTVSNCLLGDVCEKVEFYEDLNRANPMGSIIPYKKPERFTETIKYQTTLDTFCKKNAVIPDIIKIDVEGSEISVLKGGLESINEYEPKIFLSTHPHHFKMMNINNDELLRLIQKMNYSIKTVSGEMVNEIILDEYILDPI
jgi:FkbM family methyltransferase